MASWDGHSLFFAIKASKCVNIMFLYIQHDNTFSNYTKSLYMNTTQMYRLIDNCHMITVEPRIIDWLINWFSDRCFIVGDLSDVLLILSRSAAWFWVYWYLSQFHKVCGDGREVAYWFSTREWCRLRGLFRGFALDVLNVSRTVLKTKGIERTSSMGDREDWK